MYGCMYRAQGLEPLGPGQRKARKSHIVSPSKPANKGRTPGLILPVVPPSSMTPHRPPA